MNNKTKILTLALLSLCFGFVLALSSCIPATNEAADEQGGNKEYMSQVNLIMDELKLSLEGFNDAVSQEDLVTMKAQAEAAAKTVDELGKLTPPDDLKDVQSEYVKGCKSLQDALDSYIDLYTEIETATEEQPFDFEGYEDKLDKIKDKYDEGIKALENADKLATEKE